jgi:hypothetical protein
MYVILGLIGFIVIIGTVNSFRTSRNLINAKTSIDSALVLAERSNAILEKQGITIDSIRKTNANVLAAMGAIESQNKFIRESIAWKFKQSSSDLDSIRKLIEDMGEIIPPKK